MKMSGVSGSGHSPARHSAHEPPPGVDVAPPSPRSFGILMGVVSGGLAVWMVAAGHVLAGGISAGMGLVLFVAALLRPESLATLNGHWFRIGLLLHRIVSPVVLAAVFVAGLLPTAIVARTCGWISMTRRPDPRAASYWKKAVNSPLRIERQY